MPQPFNTVHVSVASWQKTASSFNDNFNNVENKPYLTTVMWEFQHGESNFWGKFPFQYP